MNIENVKTYNALGDPMGEVSGHIDQHLSGYKKVGDTYLVPVRMDNGEQPYIKYSDAFPEEFAE